MMRFNHHRFQAIREKRPAISYVAPLILCLSLLQSCISPPHKSVYAHRDTLSSTVIQEYPPERVINPITTWDYVYTIEPDTSVYPPEIEIFISRSTQIDSALSVTRTIRDSIRYTVTNPGNNLLLNAVFLSGTYYLLTHDSKNTLGNILLRTLGIGTGIFEFALASAIPEKKQIAASSPFTEMRELTTRENNWVTYQTRGVDVEYVVYNWRGIPIKSQPHERTSLTLDEFLRDPPKSIKLTSPVDTAISVDSEQLYHELRLLDHDEVYDQLISMCFERKDLRRLELALDYFEKNYFDDLISKTEEAILQLNQPLLDAANNARQAPSINLAVNEYRRIKKQYPYLYKYHKATIDSNISVRESKISSISNTLKENMAILNKLNRELQGLRKEVPSYEPIDRFDKSENISFAVKRIIRRGEWHQDSDLGRVRFDLNEIILTYGGGPALLETFSAPFDSPGYAEMRVIKLGEVEVEMESGFTKMIPKYLEVNMDEYNQYREKVNRTRTYQERVNQKQAEIDQVSDKISELEHLIR